MDFMALIASWSSSFFLPSTLNSSPWIFICILSLSFFISAIIFLAFSWLIPSLSSLTCLIAPPEAPSELLTSKTDVSYETIPVLDLCIIHLSVCEFLFINDSKNIVINEYINIAKKYSSPKMYTFLNKVLDDAL